MELRLEFTVEPFVDGRPGPHVRAAVAEARRQGRRTEMGPFATTVDGEADEVLTGLAAIVGAAGEAGAPRVALARSRRDGRPDHPVLDAPTPAAEPPQARLGPPHAVGAAGSPLALDGAGV